VAAGDHDIFVSGNDADAKARVSALLKEWFGWKSVIDLGDITTARGTEMLLPIWLRLWGAIGTRCSTSRSRSNLRCYRRGDSSAGRASSVNDGDRHRRTMTGYHSRRLIAR
jgi:hypothetical protein